MNISASVKSSRDSHTALVSTEGNNKSIGIPPKANGGSSINGGELLFLALATCFCNDIYREAAKRNMSIESVSVDVNGQFGREGEPGKNIVYHATVLAPGHSREEIQDLITYVDSIAEIHNTLRGGVDVKLN